MLCLRAGGCGQAGVAGALSRQSIRPHCHGGRVQRLAAAHRCRGQGGGDRLLPSVLFGRKVCTDRLVCPQEEGLRRCAPFPDACRAIMHHNVVHSRKHHLQCAGRHRAESSRLCTAAAGPGLACCLVRRGGSRAAGGGAVEGAQGCCGSFQRVGTALLAWCVQRMVVVVVALDMVMHCTCISLCVEGIVTHSTCPRVHKAHERTAISSCLHSNGRA